MDKERGKRKRNANFAAHEVVCSHIMYIIYKFFVIVKKIVQHYKYKTTVATDQGLRSSINNK
ncbi:hypothetical protein NQ317_000977 [Molorchus minor]|uniref:Uncharacterized protein n=1 Tax=Molorchus minor TaxID=1323400 RepID=A0ABQ9JNX4_9CUCU|nr:hypothetical protein NQ317_000977 [Molorchus minor]